ncbi:MAG: hypothetical protein ABSH03_13600 [Candidatus Lustribacter sp.]|jgi:hypothetical protein
MFLDAACAHPAMPLPLPLALGLAHATWSLTFAVALALFASALRHVWRGHITKTARSPE